MIDIENELFTIIAEKLEEQFPGISVSNIDEQIPSSFPHVYIEEANNYIPRRFRTSSDKDTVARLLYKIEIYSNKNPGKKTECKKIAHAINDIMTSLNFSRDSLNGVPNIADRRVYRLVLTYTVETDGYYMYRR